MQFYCKNQIIEIEYLDEIVINIFTKFKILGYSIKFDPSST